MQRAGHAVNKALVDGGLCIAGQAPDSCHNDVEVGFI